MSNELDELMDRDPLELSAADIDKIIAYQRKARANFESGVKPKKEAGAKVKVDLSAIVSALAPPKEAGPPVKRRV